MNRRNNRREAVCDGSSFDSFLDEEGIREEVEATAIKRVVAWQLHRAMRDQLKTKQVMAKLLRTGKPKRGCPSARATEGRQQ
jgi:hypothetical protein